MKVVLRTLTLLMIGCSSADTRSPFVPVARNMSEADVRALPPGTRFKEVSSRLRYFTRSAVAIPMISFVLGDQEAMECVMFFDKVGRLRYAWLSPVGRDGREEAVVIWPQSEVGKRLSELGLLFGSAERANQHLRPTEQGKSEDLGSARFPARECDLSPESVRPADVCRVVAGIGSV